MNGSSRFVVDASVAVKWVVPEPGWRQAVSLLERTAHGDATLIAPELYVGEVANVFWKKSVLHDEGLTYDEAVTALSRVLEAPVEFLPIEPLVHQAFELATRFRRPVYDCIYMALALRERGVLVTADEPLAQTFGVATGAVVPLAALAPVT